MEEVEFAVTLEGYVFWSGRMSWEGIWTKAQIIQINEFKKTPRAVGIKMSQPVRIGVW